MARIWISMLLSVGLPRVSFFFMHLTNAPENPRNGNGVGEGQQVFSATATVRQDVRRIKIPCGRCSGSGGCHSVDKLHIAMPSIFKTATRLGIAGLECKPRGRIKERISVVSEGKVHGDRSRSIG